MIAAAVIPHADETDLWRSISRAVRPRARVRPSGWASRHVVLRAEQSARPGPFDIYWKPWTRAIHDVHFENPGKRGAVCYKPEQVGWTRAMLNVAGCLCATDPGPVLYIMQNDDKAKEIAADEFDPTIECSAELAGLFERGAEDRRELLSHRPFVGGVVDFAGAGSPNDIISKGRKWIFADEYEAAASIFPRDKGDLFETLLGRQETYKSVGFLWAYCHPRHKGQDISKLYDERSDMRSWVFDCPHCGGAIFPRWSLVRIPRLEADSDVLDPASAVLVCPHAGCVITDAERARAVWEPGTPGREGGTGRFQSEMPAEKAAKREFVGLAVHRLCDPHVTVAALAQRWIGCTSEEARLTFYGKALGEPYVKAEAVLSPETVAECVKVTDQIVVPGGERGVRFLVVGSDVQAPRHNPTLYFKAVAYAATGHAYVVMLTRVSGFTAWLDLLTRVSVRLDGGGVLPVRLAAIDAAYETGQVLTACRGRIYSTVNGSPIELMPVKYQKHINEDNPAVLAPDRKRVDPARPELGAFDNYYYLHRHSWVDRAVRRLTEKRLTVLCPTPAGYVEHLCSNVLRPVAKQHGMDRDRSEWVKPDEFRDDWLQSLAYAEAGAALRLRLDTIHALDREGAFAGNERPEEPGEVTPRGEGWLGGFRSSGRGEYWRR